MARGRGNRPDCAYFLLLGLSLAAFFLTIGGIFTYVGYWPEQALHRSHHAHDESAELHKHLPAPAPESSSLKKLEDMPNLPSNYTNESKLDDVEKKNEDNSNSNNSNTRAQNLTLSILGPFCVILGSTVLLTVVFYALKFDCDHEPEPNIAFLRLRSELSLNFDPERNKYELMLTSDKPSGRRNQQKDEQGQRY
jgi:hypothetical protein